MTKWLYILVMLLPVACEEDQVNRQDNPACEPVRTFDNAMLHGAPFEITGAEIIDDCLRVQVRYGGGCKVHDFTLYYASLPDFSIFTGVLQLSHNSNGDLCKALCNEDICFDLTGIQEPGIHMIRLVLRPDVVNSEYQLIIDYYY